MVKKMNKYDEIKALIEQSTDFVDFAEFGKGVSEDWIEKAERRLGFKLPDSYKWWLRNYSGGQIYGDEIYSIYEMDFDTVVGGDIVYMRELNIKSNFFPDNVCVICRTNDEIYYFDLSTMNDNEYLIYELNRNECYAKDFTEFLKKMITS